MFKHLLLSSLTSLLTFLSYGQKPICAFHGNYEAGPVMSTQRFPREKIEAEQFIKKCYEVLGIPFFNVEVVLMIGLENCAALSTPFRDLLIIDPDWLDGVRNNDDWFHLYVIGHEIGHLIFEHNQSSVQYELEADKIGGLLLSKFGYPFKSLADIYPKNLYSNIETTHPKTIDRIQIVDNILKSSSELHLRQILGAAKFSIIRELTPRDKLLQSYSELETRFFRTNKIDDLNECLEILSTTYRISELRTIASKNILKLLMYAIQYKVINQKRYLEILDGLFLKINEPLFLLYKSFNHSDPEFIYDDLEIVNKSDLRAILKIDIDNLDDDDFITYSAYIFEGVIQDMVSDDALNTMESRLTKMSKLNLPIEVAAHNALFKHTHYMGRYQSALNHAKNAYYSSIKWFNKYINADIDILYWNYTNYLVSAQNLCLAHFRLGQHQEVIGLAGNMLTKQKPMNYPETKGRHLDSEFRYYLIRSSFELNRYGNIPEQYNKLEQFHQNDKIILHCVGISLVRLNRKEEGEEFLTRACQAGNGSSCFYLKK